MRRWVERDAIGVVAAITPWNVPNHINLAKLTPALAAGCTVALQPAPETPWTELFRGESVKCSPKSRPPLPAEMTRTRLR